MRGKPYNKRYFCLKHREMIRIGKVYNWCYHYNCPHLRLVGHYGKDGGKRRR